MLSLYINILFFPKKPKNFIVKILDDFLFQGNFKQASNYNFCLRYFLPRSWKISIFSSPRRKCCGWPQPNTALCLNQCSYSAPAPTWSLLSWADRLHRGCTHTGPGGETAHPRTSHRAYQILAVLLAPNWGQVCSDPSTNPVTAAAHSPPSGTHRHLWTTSKINALLWAPKLLPFKFFTPSSIPRGHLQRCRNSVPKRWEAEGNSTWGANVWYTHRIAPFYLNVDFKSFVYKTVKKSYMPLVSVSTASYWFNFRW